MKPFNLSVITLAFGIALSTGAMAATGMSRDNYKAGKDRIEAEYQTAKGGCSTLAGNPADICKAEAKGNEKVALAELDATYKPSPKSHYGARVAKADAEYGVAKERCDDMAGNAKDVCVKEAKAALVTAKADATTQMKTTDANAKAAEKSGDARQAAVNTKADARKEGASEKRDAAYSVAKEKCDSFADSAKERCLDEAKVRFDPK